MRSIVFALAMICTLNAAAQNNPVEAKIPLIESDGFYRIAIPSEIGEHLNPRFTNIRIFDEDKLEVPYILQEETPKNYTEQFHDYEIVGKIQTKKCCTVLILRNPNGNPINNIHLSIRNAEVTKSATLLGSDDKTNWFALKEQFTMSMFSNPDKTSEVRVLDFPLSNYTYYKLQINDSTSAPLNILKAGYFEVNSEDGKYTELKPASISKSDSSALKRSYIHITFSGEQIVDKLSLSMQGNPYFLRRATLFSKAARQNRKSETEYYYEPIANLVLSSKQTSIIELSELRTSDLVVVVQNDDNPPLQTNEIKILQLNRYLTAWLLKGKSYTVKIGEQKLDAPVYDLDFFRDSIPENPIVLKLNDISFQKPKETASTSPTFFTSKWYIWGGLIVVIAVLGFMAVRMINETSKRS